MGASLAFHLTFAISGVDPAEDPCIRRAWARERARLDPKACDHRRASALHGVVRADIQTGLLARRRHRLATVAARFLHTGSTRDPLSAFEP